MKRNIFYVSGFTVAVICFLAALLNFVSGFFSLLSIMFTPNGAIGGVPWYVYLIIVGLLLIMAAILVGIFIPLAISIILFLINDKNIVSYILLILAGLVIVFVYNTFLLLSAVSNQVEIVSVWYNTARVIFYLINNSLNIWITYSINSIINFASLILAVIAIITRKLPKEKKLNEQNS